MPSTVESMVRSKRIAPMTRPPSTARPPSSARPPNDGLVMILARIAWTRSNICASSAYDSTP